MARRRDWWWLPQNLGEALAYSGVSEDKAKSVIEVVALGEYSCPRAKFWRDRWAKAAMRFYKSWIKSSNVHGSPGRTT